MITMEQQHEMVRVFVWTRKHLLDLIDGKLMAECGGMFPNVDAVLDEFRAKVAALHIMEAADD